MGQVKTIKSRIQFKMDTLENWEGFVPEKGELCICSNFENTGLLNKNGDKIDKYQKLINKKIEKYTDGFKSRLYIGTFCGLTLYLNFILTLLIKSFSLVHFFSIASLFSFFYGV